MAAPLREAILRFEESFLYKFRNRDYLLKAFIFSSNKQRALEHNRYALIGDSILNHRITMHLYNTRADFNNGQLTKSRSALVDNRSFASLALVNQYDLYIQHEDGNIQREVANVRQAWLNDSMARFDKSIIKTLGDSFEAVAGAIYQDCNSEDRVWEIYYPIMRDSIERELRSPTQPGRSAYVNNRATIWRPT